MTDDASAGDHAVVVEMDGSEVGFQLPRSRFVLGNAEGEGMLHEPSAVAIAENDELFVIDAGNHRVAVFSPSGTFVRAFGRSGRGPGELTGNEDLIVVADDKVFLLEASSVTVKTFLKSGIYVGEFRLANGVTDIAAMGERLVAAHTPRTPDEPVLRVIGAQGTVERVFGDTLAFPERHPHAGRVLNRGSVAARDEGPAIAYRHWPVVRFYRDTGELSAEYWYRLDWGDGVEHVARTWRNPAWVRDQDLDMDRENIRGVVFWDIEYASDIAQWFLLTGFHIVQAIEKDGSPSAVYDLREVEERGYRRMLTDLAVSSSGRLLCAVDSLEEEVLCFDYRVAK